MPLSEYIHTLPTPNKGLAVFAKRMVPAGTAIIIEPALFSIPVPKFVPGRGFPLHEMSDAITRSFQHLSPVEQRNFVALHNHRDDIESLDEDPTAPANLMSIFRTNAYNTGNGMVGIFPKIARINHSCRPNAGNWWSERQQMRIIYAFRDITAGEEVTVSYIPLLKGVNERAKRLEQYGFACDCIACTAGLDASKESDRRRWRVEEGLSNLKVKAHDGKSRTEVINKKLLIRAQHLVAIIEDEDILDYHLEATQLIHAFASQGQDSLLESNLAAKIELWISWREGTSSVGPDPQMGRS